MNKIKFSNFINKILVMLLVIFIFSGQTIAFARAGGGSSSSSHSSSSSSHGSSSHRNLYLTSDEKVIAIALGIVAIIVIILGKAIIRKVRLAMKEHKSIATINNLSKYDDNWDFNDIKKDIETAFYMIQIAWREKNQDLAKECMSDYLYDKHKSQTDAMNLRKEKNILKNMVLLDAAPIGMQDMAGINSDYIWVHIKAKSKDYTINEETDEVIKGSASRNVYFEEYWKFIKKEKRWVVDSIKQVNEMTDLDFFRIEAPNRYD